MRITPERLARAERFFAGLRVLGALVAGISRMHWSTFIFYNALGGAVWATAAALVGFFLGSSLGLVERWMGRAIILVVGLLAITVARSQ